MEKSIGLGVFGTFGNPNGYQQSFFLNALFPQNLDLNPNAIELLPNSELFVVRRDYNKGVHSFCFCVYSFAREYQSNRRGTFIGNCVVFNDYITEGGYIYDCLKEIHSDTISNSKNIQNNMLQVQRINDLEVTEPVSFPLLVENSKKVGYIPQLPDSSKSFFIAGSNFTGEELDKAVRFFFTKSINEFPQTGTMYFSVNQQVIDVVKAKGLIKVAEWSEFKNYTNQPTQTQQSQQQPSNKKQQKKNIQVIGKGELPQLQNVERFQPSEQIFKIWNIPQYPWDMNDIKQRVEEHNKILKQYEKLEDELSRLKISIEEEGLTNKFSFFLTKNKIPIFIISTFLLILFLAYIFLFPSEEERKTAIPQSKPIVEQPTIPITPTTPMVIKLVPEPNNLLKERDIIILSGKKIGGKTVDEIVSIIFRLNPSDVEKHYIGQEKLYAKRLIELNNDCFKPYNNFMVCFCNELKKVPVYKE